MAAVDLTSIWVAVADYYRTASQITALSPVPQVIRDYPEQTEVKFNLIAVDLLQWRQNRPAASASNIHQTFIVDFNLICAARGKSMIDADDKCLAIASAIINATAGLGAYLGTNRSTVLSAEITQGSWDPSTNDNLLAECVQGLSVTFYRN